MTDLHAALETYKPAIAKSYAGLVRNMFNIFVERYGVMLKNIYNSTDCNAFKNVVRQYTMTIDNNPLAFHKEHVLDEEKLMVGANRYADLVADEWEGKIKLKLQELESSSVVHLDGSAFCISGMRGDHKITIIQHRITNVSSKGLLFHQFPARIYVDGKATSEAAYKRMYK